MRNDPHQPAHPGDEHTAQQMPTAPALGATPSAPTQHHDPAAELPHPAQMPAAEPVITEDPTAEVTHHEAVLAPAASPAPSQAPAASPAVEVDAPEPASQAASRGIDRTTLTALITFWLAFICIVAAMIISYFFASKEMEVWHFSLTIAYWVFWVVAAISSAAALLFARLRDKLAAFLMLTIVAVDLAFLLLPLESKGSAIYHVLRLFIDFDLLAAATYIATRKPRS